MRKVLSARDALAETQQPKHRAVPVPTEARRSGMRSLDSNPVIRLIPLVYRALINFLGSLQSFEAYTPKIPGQDYFNFPEIRGVHENSQ